MNDNHLIINIFEKGLYDREWGDARNVGNVGNVGDVH
jgi:hypothetical protein